MTVPNGTDKTSGPSRRTPTNPNSTTAKPRYA
jgi:uncharacterized protein